MLLKEVCEFRNGKAHEQYVDTDGQYILVTSKFISSDGKLYRRTNQQMTPLFRGDICMVMSDVPNGKALAKCFLVDEDNKYTLNQRIGSFTVDNRFDKKYFYYLMNRNKYFLSFNDGNGQTNLRKDDILKFTFDYIPIEDQHSIVQKLDKLKEIIEKRQHELQTFDELIKARFVEMFGDPVSNSLRWKKERLADVCLKLNDGTHFSPESFETGDYKYITAKNIKLDGFDFSNITYVPESTHRPIYERCNPEKGDVLFIKDGVTTGIAMVNPLEEEFTLLSSVALLKQNRSIINGHFLCGVLNNQDMYCNIRSNMGGAAITRLTIAKIKEIKVIMPPLELQDEFEEFVKEVDKSKVVVQNALDEAQTLFDSLMQEYFG